MNVTLERIDDHRWRIPPSGSMRVPGLIYADASLMEQVARDRAAEQVANVACLPGIVKYSIAMPDIHWGYGFPIGGVAAFDDKEGIVSPGGVGYDINCGVRMLATSLTASELRPRLRGLAEALFRRIPTGVGAKNASDRLGERELEAILEHGARRLVERGVGVEADLVRIEEGGRLEGADPKALSPRARERGRAQLGTVGSGNHFVEVQEVHQLLDANIAAALGLAAGTVVVMIHSGSRGLGYQVCDEHVRTMLAASRRYGIELPDRQLCCAPLSSAEGRHYLAAMAAAANFAFANRHMMAERVREALETDLGLAPDAIGLRTVYDVCHNIAKFETHTVDGICRRLCVHRKGATRAFGPGHPSLPPSLQSTGQPVLIPGDMGRSSYVLVGRQGAEEAFGSACHGAGRQMSRKAAKRSAAGRNVEEELRRRGIEIRAAGRGTVLEEISEAYKDAGEVTAAVEGAGLARRVAELRPMAVVKG